MPVMSGTMLGDHILCLNISWWQSFSNRFNWESAEGVDCRMPIWRRCRIPKEALSVACLTMIVDSWYYRRTFNFTSSDYIRIYLNHPVWCSCRNVSYRFWSFDGTIDARAPGRYVLRIKEFANCLQTFEKWIEKIILNRLLRCLRQAPLTLKLDRGLEEGKCSGKGKASSKTGRSVGARRTFSVSKWNSM